MSQIDRNIADDPDQTLHIMIPRSDRATRTAIAELLRTDELSYRLLM